METTVPYHPDFLLGCSVDMKTMKPGDMLIGKKVNPTKQEVNQSSLKCSVVKSLKDVCEVFSFPPEYALKVQAGLVKNQMIKDCLQDLDKENSFTIIYTATFLQQKQFLDSNVVPEWCSNHFKEQVEIEVKQQTTESLIAEAVADSRLSICDQSLPGQKHIHHGTHWVQAMEIGNELVIKMTLSCKVNEHNEDLWSKLCECLQTSCGQLDTTKMPSLHKLAVKTDKNLSKKHYRDISLTIQYYSFTELDKYPASMTGMANTLENFMDQCVGWAERSRQGSYCEVQICGMKCMHGTYKEEKASVKVSKKHMVSNLFFAPSIENDMYSPLKETQMEIAETNVYEELDSFVILKTSGSWFCYNLRVQLKSFKKDNDETEYLRSFALSEFSKSPNNIFNNLFKVLVDCEKSSNLLQNFHSAKCHVVEAHSEECRKVSLSIQSDQFVVLNTVTDMDFTCIPTNVTTSNPLSMVKLFIEDMTSKMAISKLPTSKLPTSKLPTSKLPPGSDIDLLMLGKTGNGKSSTGNTILGRGQFATSGDMESMTKDIGVGWTEIDGRRIKVIDTPGMYDTYYEDNNKASVDRAIKVVSNAIAKCTEGFHALLLIIRFGVRFTDEEKKSIFLLKRVLGEGIIKSHTIFVITHGDLLEREMKEKNITSFQMWCKNKTGFLQKLFEECNFRCVVFNNNTENSEIWKEQLIQLVSMVDSLQNRGIRYTNELFKYAQNERKKLISQKNVYQVEEETMRDIQLISENLQLIINDTNDPMQHKATLLNLKQKVDAFSSRVSQTDNVQFAIVSRMLAGLSVSIHKKMEEIDNHLKIKNQNESRAASENEIGPGTMELVPSYLNFSMAKRDFAKFYKKEVLPVQINITDEVAKIIEPEIEKKNCFPESSVVTLSSGKSVLLKELQVGDKVLVRDNAGHLSYDTVYMFGHKEFETSNEFIAMKAGSYTVYVTAEHYVYCIKHEKEVCVAAKDVQVGDCLLVVTSEGLVPQSVETITFEKKRGLFAPFTNSGCIIIDGVLMSCYIDVLSHTTCHTLLWPVRQLYHISPRMLSLINGSYLQYPVPRSAKAALKLM